MRALQFLSIACSIWIAGCSGRALRAVDLDGVEHLLADAQRPASVLIFSAHECPISNSYAPQINRLWSDFQPRGVAFFLVQVDPDLSLEQAQRHAQDYSYACPVLLDPQHELVSRFQATTTPEAVLLSSSGAVLYRGRIDDQYADLGVRRARATSSDLRDALEAVLTGGQVPSARTVAVGCPIGDLKRGVVQ